MTAYTQVARSQQVPLDEPYVLSVDEMVSTESGIPAAEDLILANAFWNRRTDSFAENMARNAIFQAWRSGACGSFEAFNALIHYDAIDFEVVVGLYADYSAALAMGESV